MIQSARHGTCPPVVLALLAACALSLSAVLLVVVFSADEGFTGGNAPALTEFRVGQGVPTVFVAMAVERVERQALPRPARGALLDVTVAFINLRAAAIPLASARVGVRGPDGKLLAGSPPAGSPEFVAARGAVRATFRFILPTASPALQVELTDATMTSPAVVDLGASAGIPIVKELDAPPHTH